ncbi:MAG: YlbL family protein [Actinomycetota bacterium]
MRRKLLALLLLAVFLAPVVVAAFLIRLPLLILEPGPAPDVASLTEIVARTYPSEGAIHLTTAQVREPEGSTTVEILQGLVDPFKQVLPREAVYPSDRSEGATVEVQAAQMAQSESAATVAALSELGMSYEPDGVFVKEVDQKAPAARRIKPGDIIFELASAPVATVEQLEQILRQLRPDREVSLRLRREGRQRSVRTRTVAGSQEAALGLSVSQSHRAPIEVDISAEEIGGPSAGLMFALSIYDQLIPEDLTAGATIAGTGTIDNLPGQDGVVGEVGAVELKVRAAQRIGAEVFLVASKEAARAREAAPEAMVVIGVSSLKQAIAELRRLAERP